MLSIAKDTTDGMEELQEKRMRRYLQRRLHIFRPTNGGSSSLLLAMPLALPNLRGVPDSVYEKFVKGFEHLYNKHEKGLFGTLNQYFKQDATWMAKHYASSKRALPGGTNPFGTHETVEFANVSFYFDSLESFFDVCPDGVVQFTSYRLRHKDNITIFRANYLAQCTIVAMLPVAAQRNACSVGRLLEFAVPVPGQDSSTVQEVSQDDVDEVRQIVFDAQIYKPYQHPDRASVSGLHFDESALNTQMECEETLVVLPMRLKGFLQICFDEADHRISRGEFHYCELPNM